MLDVVSRQWLNASRPRGSACVDMLFLIIRVGHVACARAVTFGLLGENLLSTQAGNQSIMLARACGLGILS